MDQRISSQSSTIVDHSLSTQYSALTVHEKNRFICPTREPPTNDAHSSEWRKPKRLSIRLPISD
ncbi:hypothetical protein OF83DRAFT_1122610 [Amylostereum chailletii]|nr:hypothetical protein OF83DRAFT_1122610 [Amylostereum chailletii]